MVYSEEKAKERIKQLTEEGLECIPYDNPERALKGFLFSNEVETGINTEEIVQWTIFGEEFTPEIKDVEIDELQKFIEKYQDVLPCDDPEKLKIGFVHYDIENKVSVIRRVSLSALKELGKENSVLKFRKVLLSSRN